MPDTGSDLPDLTFPEIKANIARGLSQQLSKTFDAIAKTAIRASAEFSEVPEGEAEILPTIQKAHSLVTLIIDDAMRGLGEATTYAMCHATVSTLMEEDSRKPEAEI